MQIIQLAACFYILNVHTTGRANQGTTWLCGYYPRRFLPKIMMGMVWIMFLIVPVISIGAYIVSLLLYYENLHNSILNAWFLMYPLINVLNILCYIALIRNFANDIQGNIEEED